MIKSLLEEEQEYQDGMFVAIGLRWVEGGVI